MCIEVAMVPGESAGKSSMGGPQAASLHSERLENAKSEPGLR